MYRTATMCRVLGVSSSGYYAWRRRAPCARSCADRALTKRIQAIHERSRGTYGVPRVHAELEAEGVRVGRKRVARLMRGAGLAGVSRRKGARTTQHRQEARPAPDLVDRNFTAEAPDRLWVADITIRSDMGGVFVSGRWRSMRSAGASWGGRWPHTCGPSWCSTRSTWRCISAVPEAVIHHSDQGTQYTSVAFGQRCRQAGVRPSMGSVGDCYDNALCESFFATLECELLARHQFPHPGPRRAWRCSGSSRASTTRIVGTPPSTTCHPLTTKGDNNAHPENPSA